jgi:hypothetical protein
MITGRLIGSSKSWESRLNLGVPYGRALKACAAPLFYDVNGCGLTEAFGPVCSLAAEGLQHKGEADR